MQSSFEVNTSAQAGFRAYYLVAEQSTIEIGSECLLRCGEASEIASRGLFGAVHRQVHGLRRYMNVSGLRNALEDLLIHKAAGVATLHWIDDVGIVSCSQLSVTLR